MARVGVCTRPIESVALPRPNFVVKALVAFIPKSQSPIALADPAAYKLSYCLASFNLLNPSLIASSVSEEIQSLLMGLLHFAFNNTQRCISSPSCPASPQLMTSVQFATKFSMQLNCFCIPASSTTFIPKFGGIIGKSSNFQYFQFSL